MHRLPKTAAKGSLAARACRRLWLAAQVGRRGGGREIGKWLEWRGQFDYLHNNQAGAGACSGLRVPFIDLLFRWLWLQSGREGEERERGGGEEGA